MSEQDLKPERMWLLVRDDGHIAIPSATDSRDQIEMDFEIWNRGVSKYRICEVEFRIVTDTAPANGVIWKRRKIGQTLTVLDGISC